MNRKGNIRNTIMIFSILALLAAGSLYYYFNDVTSGLVDNTLNARSVLATAQAARLQGGDTMKLFDATAERRAKLSTFFVPAENAVAVIQAIESVGDLSGASVDISSIKSTPAIGDKIGQVSASVVIRGAWTNVMQGLELFETLPYQKILNNLVIVTSSIPGASDKDKTPKWDVSFDIAVPTIIKS